ncbi:MAG: LamG domain-containing protein, partial [Verrucomicrobiota bacterium]
ALDLINGNDLFIEPCSQSAYAIENTGYADPATNAVTLNGRLQAPGAVFTVELYHGPNDGGINAAAWSNVVTIGTWSNAPDTNLTHTLTGLSPGTSGYYRYRAFNAKTNLWAQPSSEYRTRQDLRAWTHSMAITLCGYDRNTTLVDFPVLLTLSEAIPGYSPEQLASINGHDLRFTRADQTEFLAYDIETWNPESTEASRIWVNLPELSGTDTVIHMLWGNPAADQPAYATNGSAWVDAIGIWHMSETNAQDASGNGWHGTGSSNTPTAGRIDLAQAFTGGEHIHMGPGLDVSNTSFTVSAWVRRNSNSVNEWVVSHGVSQPEKGLHFGFRANNQFAFAFWSDDLNIGGHAEKDEWHFWTGVFDASAGRQTVYKDGVEIGSRIAAAPYQGDAGTLFRIGERYGTERFNGAIDEVRLIGAAHSADRTWTTWKNVASNHSFACFGSVDTERDLPLISNDGGTKSATGTNAWLTAHLIGDGGAPATVTMYWGLTDGGTNPAAWTNTISL